MYNRYTDFSVAYSCRQHMIIYPHTRRKAGIQYHGWQASIFLGVWIPVTPVGVGNKSQIQIRLDSHSVFHSVTPQAP